LLYSTFVGGSGHDFANAIALDLSGAAYIAGHTYSADFPVTTKVLQMRANGHPACRAAGRDCADAFVTKLSARAILLYSSVLGGNGDQRANAIAVDNTGGAYITGRTDSADFPATPHALSTSVSNRGGVLSSVRLVRKVRR
jgi:hypothetical protein